MIWLYLSAIVLAIAFMYVGYLFGVTSEAKHWQQHNEWLESWVDDDIREHDARWWHPSSDNDIWD